LLAKGGPKETALASGVGTFPVNTWHRLTLKFALDKITAMIDGKTVVDALQDETYEQGLVGYEVGSYQNAEFQNLDVTAVQTDAIPSSVIKAAATSFEPGYEPSKAVDGDSDTFWHTEFSAAKPPLPQSITIDLGAVYTLSGLRYLPRQDGSANGRIIQYVVYTSMDGTAFEKSVAGDWADDASRKSTSLPSVQARFVRSPPMAATYPPPKSNASGRSDAERRERNIAFWGRSAADVKALMPVGHASQKSELASPIFSLDIPQVMCYPVA
jgi:hypothetical protein